MNLARSAIAPDTSAGVITANMSWNIENASSGILYTDPLMVVICFMASPMPTMSKPPKNPLPLMPKATENPNNVHRTLTMPIVTNDIISMLRTLLARTMPP